MKKITRNVAVLAFALFGAFSANAQKQPLNATGKAIIGQEPTFKLTEANKTGIALTGYARCLTVENEQLLQAKYPNRATDQEFEQMLAPVIAKIKADRLAGKAPQVIYNIPVVVHIVHNGNPINNNGAAGNENISDAQALSQINVMNQDFRRIMATPGGANTTGLAVDVEINFCMAQTDPNGNLTNGIVRHNITPYSNTDTPAVVDDWEKRADTQAMKAATQWNPTEYLNMWTFKPGGLPLNQGGQGGLLGYAQFPSNSGLVGLNVNGGGANTDGVTAAYDAFGTIAANDGSFVMNATYNLGRTMTHEVGHWLGLRHVWGDGDRYDPTGVNGTPQGSCPVDDFCADTPNARAANYTCNSADNCGGGVEQKENYMDYTNDACMDTFTQDQKDRVQAVMAVSPRRVELNTSVKCNAPTPYVSFANTTQTINESTDCAHTDTTITVKIGKAPSAVTNVTITAAGTATAADYQIMGGNLTFPMGATADQTFVLRIYNDGFVEGNETLTLGLTVNANGGDAVVTTAVDKENAITITDDDAVPNALTITSVFTYTGGIAGIGLINADGNSTWGNYTSGINVPGVIEPDFLGSRAVIADGTTDDYVIMPELTIPAGITSLSLEHALVSANGTQNYELWFTTDSSNTAGVLAGTLLSSGTATDYTGAATTLEVINLTAFINGVQGQTGSLVLRHTGAASGANDDGYLFWDTITLSAQTATGVQTAVNTGAATQIGLASAGIIYNSDNTSGDMMANINNTNGVDYGCVSTSVSRASGTAQQYQVAGAANFVTDKTFTITPTTVQAAGDATVKFYFTETEIAAWETATGNNRSTLVIIKDNGTQEITTATIGAFGSEVTLTGTFATGIKGTYYFGKETSLTVADNDFALFNVYPNPSNGNVNITLGTNEDVQVSLFDIRGRKVYTNQFNNNAAIFNKTVDFSAMASGVYMLTIESGAKKATKKLVIQ